ncbi:HlyD family type I secretion periplasmic adaptor subunit [Phaeobacter sp. HS012]|uniref:HlyD family type I secretion periplasmic adaptor subunit n=1 Tax=Phaeobacter TaxID=302485 RepID=UPI000406C8E6|nr:MULTISPECIES: HlyD family type I secretion periplasmic adaptor subunit [Phaeobacter]AUQ56819.1 putative type I secretion membrane fusion protein [Phaeobacter inhibens]AUQ61032.1 putative type I secretion membrane fusion protein [Phaeobacter inhibens]AUQ80836.1 putative type I secretion membrane fusion protein [Phaeobacter inhibens]AUR10027.1 putative type I secretion membrane fusion protein [Phaeobacter inhibens]AUR13898.1 putative type I secretion membrane fusion protein [Phaeobacter inhib
MSSSDSRDLVPRKGSEIEMSRGFQDLMPDGFALPRTPPTRVRQLVMWMLVCGFGLFGGLVFWATQAEMTSAVVASGQFTVAGDRLSVQHLEGGIVREINVAEGDMVAEGDVIAVLDGRRMRASRAILTSQMASLLAQQARLQAELAEADQIEVPAELDQLIAEDPQLVSLFEVQRDVFTSNRALYEGQVQILRDRISQLGKQLNGRQARITAIEDQLTLIKGEVADLHKLYEKGLVPKTRLSDRQLQHTGLMGTFGALESDSENIQERIAETEERILQVHRDTVNRISSETQLVQERILDLRQRLDAAEDVLERQIIRAPQAGRVVELSINTLGQVLNPGQNVLELVPSGSDLIVETRVSPTDIDEVVTGGQARVQLTAYSFRSTPPVRGEVVMVAADSIADLNSGIPYYRVHIRIPPEELAALPNVKTLPGMPAQAMIETGRQTLADYLLSPVLRSMSNALREGNG